MATATEPRPQALDEQRIPGGHGRLRLIEGRAGPFYVALNAATFYLIAAVYAVASVVLVFVLRDKAQVFRLALAVFIPFETGLLAHVYVEKLRGWPAGRSRLLHLLISVLSLPLAVLTLIV